MSALGRLALFCLRHARSPEQIWRGIRGWLRLLRDVGMAPHGPAALEHIWRYILEVDTEHTVEEVVAMLNKALGEEERKGLGSVADQLIERGRKAGLQEGRQEGRQEGQREMLLKLLDARFGNLPATAISRVMAATSTELDLWFERGLVASTLAAVLDEV